jgi:prevent-host-death family protein
VAKPSVLSSEELRRSVSETLKRVAYTGEEFVVTLYGKPVAKIVPIEEGSGGKARKAKADS